MSVRPTLLQYIQWCARALQVFGESSESRAILLVFCGVALFCGEGVGCQRHALPLKPISAIGEMREFGEMCWRLQRANV